MERLAKLTIGLFLTLLTACSAPYASPGYNGDEEVEMQRPNTGTTFGVKTGWGQSGTLTAGDRTKQVTMQAEFPETGSFTAQFDKDGPLLTINEDPIMPEALITWVVEGHIVTRRITVGDGASITGVGQAVKIQMTDATTSTNLPSPVTPTDYGVSVQVARGVRGASKQPPTLVLHDIIPSATSVANLLSFGGGTFGLAAHSFVSIVVPPDAGATMLYITAIATSGTPTLAAGDILVTQELGIGAGGKEYDAFNYLDWVPLNPGVTDILITNNSAQSFLVTATLGIDG